MQLGDVVSMRFYLRSAELDAENVGEIVKHLGATKVARTVVVQELLDPKWLVEVEAVAARVD